MQNTPSGFVVTSQHPESKRWAIFEEDGPCAYLYLTKPDTLEPERDCWVYNTIPAPPLCGHSGL
jgi:hypothetical protein